MVFANGTFLDFDPEDEESGQLGSDDESGSEIDENAGREHYEKVGYVIIHRSEDAKPS